MDKAEKDWHTHTHTIRRERWELKGGAVLAQLPSSSPVLSLSLSPPSSHSDSLAETERPMSELGEFMLSYMA